MKGIVFSELVAHIESTNGYEMVDGILSIIDSPTKGSYTAIGSYPFSELVQIISEYSKRSGKEVEQILKEFGHHLFGMFLENYGHFFEKCNNAFDFLSSVDSYIHVEVTKLYPDAQLPSFKILSKNEQKLELLYSSERSLSYMAFGLIESTLAHYKEEGAIEMKNIKNDGTEVQITITKQ